MMKTKNGQRQPRYYKSVMKLKIDRQKIVNKGKSFIILRWVNQLEPLLKANFEWSDT